MYSLTQARLQELFSYNPVTGELTRKVSRSSNAKAGSVAGAFDSDGYVRIFIDGHRYGAHSLAWMWCHGEWPTKQIDHINGIPHDNRISNLRDVSIEHNQQNKHRAQANNKSSGLRGVALRVNTGKWQASIVVNRKKKHLGLYLTPEDAHVAYLAAKRVLHPGCPVQLSADVLAPKEQA